MDAPNDIESEYGLLLSVTKDDNGIGFAKGSVLCGECNMRRAMKLKNELIPISSSRIRYHIAKGQVGSQDCDEPDLYGNTARRNSRD